MYLTDFGMITNLEGRFVLVANLHSEDGRIGFWSSEHPRRSRTVALRGLRRLQAKGVVSISSLF
jgi:hypothetical protein